jgi:hypothetical protein
MTDQIPQELHGEVLAQTEQIRMVVQAAVQMVVQAVVPIMAKANVVALATLL